MLPVGPPGYGESPYSAESTFAGNPMLVSPEGLVAAGLLDPAKLRPEEPLRDDRVDYVPMARHRTNLLRAAFDTFQSTKQRRGFGAFCESNSAWLDEFALFRALKRAHGGVQWTRWPATVRDRDPDALAAARRDLAHDIALEKFEQFVFEQQWQDLRAYARARGVGLIGDLPIFVAHDSADVWQHPEAFRLDRAGEPTVVAGCPPDYFSVSGQRWGNPLYRWRHMKATGYAWWIDRLRVTLRRFDAVRLDHFIGFQRYWEIPATEPTAVRGRWMKGPGADFFDAVERALGHPGASAGGRGPALPLIAEDLGEATPAVYALRDRFRFPGIRLLQFAFGADRQAKSFLPHNYPRRAVVYTGTHDNDTVVGWFHDRGGPDSTRSAEQAARERDAALRYLGTTGDEIHWDMIRAALASVARLAVVPVQDLLGLGSEARMNRPGKATGNWSWRVGEGALSPAVAARLASMTRTYGRAAPERETAEREPVEREEAAS
jgi:4-alpha-glucanotransferase